jgi:hypothetical protein
LTISAEYPCIVLLQETGGGGVKLSWSTSRGPLMVNMVLSSRGGARIIIFNPRGGPAMGASQVQSIRLS